jgi:uncharacterized protein (TIGR00369 family)
MTTPTNENLKPLAHGAQNRCFGCGQANPAGLHLEFLLADDGRVVCLANIPDAFEGPPGYLHGGIIATLLDETMSKAVRSHGLVAMTRHMEVDYQRPVKSASPIRLDGLVTRSEGRKHWVEAKITDAEGAVLAQGKGLFIEVQPRREALALRVDAIPTEGNPHG